MLDHLSSRRKDEIQLPINPPMSKAQSLMVPVSAGDLLDKITILRLKASKIKRHEALVNVQNELKALENVQHQAQELLQGHQQEELTAKLQQINKRLWEVEDLLRLRETENRFDDEFIQLARSVYHLNDQRAVIKRKINEACGSKLIEEKSYGEKRRPDNPK